MTTQDPTHDDTGTHAPTRDEGTHTATHADPARVGDLAAALRTRARTASTEEAAQVAGYVWDDVDEHQARTRVTAWEADVAAQCFNGLAQRTLADIDNLGHRSLIERYVQQYVAGDKRVLNLILAGTVGARKTTAALIAGQLAVRAGLSARVVSHHRYLGMLRPDGAPQGMTANSVRTRYRTVDLLIVDDLCAAMSPAAEATDFVRTETMALYGDRLNSGRATITTTNETSAIVNAILGDQNLSRIAGAGHVLEFVTADSRKPVTWG